MNGSDNALHQNVRLRPRVKKIDTPEAKVKEEETLGPLTLRVERDMNGVHNALCQNVQVQETDTPEAQVKRGNNWDP